MVDDEDDVRTIHDALRDAGALDGIDTCYPADLCYLKIAEQINLNILRWEVALRRPAHEAQCHKDWADAYRSAARTLRRPGVPRGAQIDQDAADLEFKADVLDRLYRGFTGDIDALAVFVEKGQEQLFAALKQISSDRRQKGLSTSISGPENSDRALIWTLLCGDCVAILEETTKLLRRDILENVVPRIFEVVAGLYPEIKRGSQDPLRRFERFQNKNPDLESDLEKHRRDLFAHDTRFHVKTP